MFKVSVNPNWGTGIEPQSTVKDRNVQWHPKSGDERTWGRINIRTYPPEDNKPQREFTATA